MASNTLIVNEVDRLRELDELAVMYTEPEAVFDRVTTQLAEVFGAPTVMMNLIDRDTQFIKSGSGLPVSEVVGRVMCRKDSICNHVVDGNRVLVIDDLLADPRFRDNPIVKEKGLRFYAGAPLRTETGQAIGALCVVDTKPRHISDREQSLLKMVADGLMTEIKLRNMSKLLLERTRVVERDLAAARVVQRFLLPPQKQEGDRFTFTHFYHPVAAIGGDFVDCRVRADGSLAWLLADVSGHGASAALTSAMVKSIFQNAAMTSPGPGDLLTAVDRELSRAVESGQFVTAAAAMFDPATRRVSMASAGHPMPILLRDGHAAVLDTVNELPLLIEPEQIYAGHTTADLRAGDRLLLYTDGATEAADPTGAMLGVEGLLPMIQAHTDLLDGDYLKSLFGSIREFAHGHLKDDVALVCLEVH